MKTVFKITIKNWTKHNSNKKKNHRYFLLENRFFYDTKILNCSALDTMLFINCLCIASDLCSDCIEVSVKSFSTQLRLTSNSLQTRLETLQQLQLVSYEKKDSLLIQEKRKQEKKRKTIQECKIFEPSKNSEKNEEPFQLKIEGLDHQQVDDPIEVNTSHLVSFYIEKWQKLYDTCAKPEFKDSELKNLKTFAFGTVKKPKNKFKRTKEIIETYLEMKDAFFALRRHDLTTMLSNLNAISLFQENGKLVTKMDLRELEKETNYEQTLRKIREEGI